MNLRLRYFLVTALALALVLGPCLSISGFVAPGSMHAHGVPDHAGPQDNGHGSLAAGVHDHGTGMASHQDGDPAQSCDKQCDGWAVKAKSKKFWAAAATAVPEPDDRAIMAGLVYLTTVPFGVRSLNRFTLERIPSRHSSALPRYAVTNRYRI